MFDRLKKSSKAWLLCDEKESIVLAQVGTGSGPKQL
jgi:hypothetical protein